MDVPVHIIILALYFHALYQVHLICFRAPDTASVSTQPTLSETMHNDYSNLASIDENYSTSQTHSLNGM